MIMMGVLLHHHLINPGLPTTLWAFICIQLQRIIILIICFLWMTLCSFVVVLTVSYSIGSTPIHGS